MGAALDVVLQWQDLEHNTTQETKESNNGHTIVDKWTGVVSTVKVQEEWRSPKGEKAWKSKLNFRKEAEWQRNKSWEKPSDKEVGISDAI